VSAFHPNTKSSLKAALVILTADRAKAAESLTSLEAETARARSTVRRLSQRMADHNRLLAFIESEEAPAPKGCSGCADGCAECADPCAGYGCYGSDGAWSDPAVRRAVRETIAQGGEQ
jgi:hypothetical protein